MHDTRSKRVEFAAKIGILVNIVLAIVKGVTGVMANSKALIADAVNSASDVVGSMIVLIGIRASKLPPDDDHPYGHGKAEMIAAIIVSVIICIIGIQMGISSLKTIWDGVTTPPKSYAMIVLIGTIIIKEILFQYKFRLGKKLGSHALIVNAWDHRSDVYASIAALIGVAGAIMGAYLNLPLAYYLDPIAGIVVSLIVVKMGYRLASEAVHNTMDHVLHKEDTEHFIKVVQQITGVLAVDELRAREHGYYIIIDLKISVNPRISVREGHDIARNVKQTLLRTYLQVTDVFVHVNPYDPAYLATSSKQGDSDDIPTIVH